MRKRERERNKVASLQLDTAGNLKGMLREPGGSPEGISERVLRVILRES